MGMNLKQTFFEIYRGLFTTSIQKRLGYSENTKLLIIHADDLGLSDSENAATIEALGKGIVNSASIMVPCKGFLEASEYARNNPTADIGIHLTITDEWNSYKWGPIMPPGEVRSLVDNNGYFFADKETMIENANSVDIEKELRAQIDYAIKEGIDITHLDSHMYTAFSPKVLKICSKLGEEYKVPLLLTMKLPIRYLMPMNAIIVNELYCAKSEHYQKGLINYYKETLNSIKPGLNCILVHTAYDNKEMRDIAGDQIFYGAAWRQTDFDFFTSEECRNLIAENNIKLITWREIRDKLVR